MADIVWHLHRDDFHPEKNTVRGKLTGRGREDAEVIVLETVENLARRIPAGDYQCLEDYYHGGDYPTWEIQWPWDEDGDGEPDRDRLLFHAANAVRNEHGKVILLGCVAPGLTRVDSVWETFGKTPHPLAAHLPGVASSRNAFDRFSEHNRGVQSFVLRVTEEPQPEG